MAMAGRAKGYQYARACGRSVSGPSWLRKALPGPEQHSELGLQAQPMFGGTPSPRETTAPFMQGFFSLQTRGMKAAPKLMEVILTADINKVGKAGDIVKVAKGYARNMLIPQLLALPKLDKYVDVVRKQLEAVKVDHPEEETVDEVIETQTEEERLKELNIVLNRLDTQRVVVRRHTPRKSNVLRKSVMPEDLVAEVKKQQKIQLEEINLEMTTMLKTLGDYEVPLRLPKSVQIPGGKAKIFLKVRVRRA